MLQFTIFGFNLPFFMVFTSIFCYKHQKRSNKDTRNLYPILKNPVLTNEWSINHHFVGCLRVRAASQDALLRLCLQRSSEPALGALGDRPMGGSAGVEATTGSTRASLVGIHDGDLAWFSERGNWPAGACETTQTRLANQCLWYLKSKSDEFPQWTGKRW